MNRDALGPALVAFLCILALGVGASALDSPTSAGNTGAGIGSGGLGFGESDVFSIGQSGPSDPSRGVAIQKIVLQLLVAALFVGSFVALYLKRDEVSFRNLGVITTVLFVLGVALAAVLLYANPAFERDTNGSGGILGEQPFTFPGGGSPSNEVQTVMTDQSVFALVLAGVLVVGIAVVLARRSSRGDDSTPDPESEVTGSETVTELGRAAGRAADRISTSGATANEVYRAWYEMTDHLDVEHPQSSTPGEFAHAATDAGMAREDVDELTTLFETTRYGGNDATTERETRAVDALRSIEDEYGGES